MAATVVVVPDIGDFENIPVIEILVSPGETVEAEQSLVSLESDKATMEVPAPGAGVVGAIKVAIGDMVSQGSALLELEFTASDDEATLPGSDRRSTPGAKVAGTTPERQGPAPAAAVSAGEHPTSTDGSSNVDRSAPGAPTSNVYADPETERAKVTHASPTIRRFARTLGVDLANVVGAGPKGRILRADVERYVKQRLTQPGPAVAAPGATVGIPPIPTVDFSKFGPVKHEALSRIKRISGPFLQRAWLNVPHVTYLDEVDITELEAFRKSLKNDPAAKGARITPLPFFMKVLSAALREFPVFNSSLSPDGQELVLKQYFHIGVAVDTPGGLVVPVVRDVDTKGIIAIAEELSEISARAREGKLKADEMQGGCMSISSLGGIGGIAFTPIVNAPEVAILGIARSRMAPVWDGAEFVPRLMLPLCLSFDHRVVDGAESARFMSFLCDRLADVRTLLL